MMNRETAGALPWTTSGQPSTAPVSTASFHCRSRLTTKYPHPLTPGNRRSHACFRLLSSPNHFPEASNAPMVRCWRQRRREAAAGWWPTSPSSRSGGRRTTPASWPPTTSSMCLATASPQAGGTAPAPPRSGCRAKHRRPGSRPCSRAATRRLVSCWGAPMAATPSQRLTWSCGQPRACPSSTAWGTRSPDEPCWPPITRDWPRRWPTWTSTWAPAAATAVSSTCPARGSGRPRQTRPAPAHPAGGRPHRPPLP
jgi:hypothetical protein